MILACHHISKAFLEKPVLNDVTFHIEKGEKCALVGINGAGKSTLLKIIMGELEPDSGTVVTERGLTVGYLAQIQNVSSENTIYEELLSVKADVIAMENQLTDYEHRMASVRGEELNELLDRYNLLQAKFKSMNGYGYRGEVQGIMNGLGFSTEDGSQKIGTLSGGQKTRVALGKLLLERPDLILLDEPTNHLDINSIQWLEGFLVSYKGAVLIVSHDRYFLDRIVTKVIELDNTRATVFTGNYSAYAEQKKVLRDSQMKAYLNNQAEIKHQEEVIRKLRQFNREKSIRRAESREKMLDKMEVAAKPVEVDDEMRIELRPCITSGRDVLHAEDLAMSFDDNKLFSGISFDISRGEHVAVIGANGTGKTTLLKIINGLLVPDRGTLRTGVNVHIGYYDQEHHVLNNENTVFEEISDAHPDMDNTQIRNLLAQFLFTGEDVFKKIGDLSGGEKGRVSLAKLMLSEANFLILDEPTNHLDMVSKEVLENALNSYAGTVLYVSHDRYFINHTASRIMALTDGKLLNFPGYSEKPAPECFIGCYDHYLEESAKMLSAGTAQDLPGTGRGEESAGNKDGAAGMSGTESGAARNAQKKGSSLPVQEESSGGALDWKTQKELQAKLRKKENDLKKCEDRISELEQRSAAIDEEMALPENCTNIGKLNDLTREKEKINTELESLYERWEELSE